MYLDISTGEYPITENEIRQRLQHRVSFPSTMDAELARFLGFEPVRVLDKPSIDEDTQELTADAPQEANGEWVQGWIVSSLSDEMVAANALAKQRAQRAQALSARAAAVEAIKVTTTAGNTFDGDEVSQTRMTRAILALQATGTPTVNWVLADNTVIDATAAELTEALALAGAAQAAIWVV